MFFDSSYAQGHKGKLVLSFFHSSKYKKKKIFWIPMNTNNRSQCDVVHHFAEVFKSLSDYKREKEKKNNWLCFALPVKTRERMRGFLPSSISFLACWQLYKSLWNNCVFLIKCEVVAISMLGFGADVLSAFKDVSVRLICAPVHRVGAITQAWGDS